MLDGIEVSAKPAISVVIATKNRAELLYESIQSVLLQTFTDFELIIVDDGSTDDTKELVLSIQDDRIRYLTTGSKSRGISAARNLGADNSRGEWTAVHDDDDLMLPHRLAEQYRCVSPDVDLVYGAFINFDDETGALEFHHGRNYRYGAAIHTGFAPGHSTWLIRTDIVRKLRYDEGLESAVDNNLAFRVLRSGGVFVHSGTVCLLRRVHSGRITNTGGSGQKYAALLNLDFLSRRIGKVESKNLWKESQYDWGPVEKLDWQRRYLPLLPDHLVARSGIVVSNVDEAARVVQCIEARELSWYDVVRAYGSFAENQHHCLARFKETQEVEDSLSQATSEESETLEGLADIVAGMHSLNSKNSNELVVVVALEETADSSHSELSQFNNTWTVFFAGREFTAVAANYFDTTEGELIQLRSNKRIHMSVIVKGSSAEFRTLMNSTVKVDRS